MKAHNIRTFTTMCDLFNSSYSQTTSEEDSDTKRSRPPSPFSPADFRTKFHSETANYAPIEKIYAPCESTNTADDDALSEHLSDFDMDVGSVNENAPDTYDLTPFDDFVEESYRSRSRSSSIVTVSSSQFSRGKVYCGPQFGRSNTLESFTSGTPMTHVMSPS